MATKEKLVTQGNPGPVNIVVHFPPLPIATPKALREPSPVPSCLSSNSEESICSARSTGHIVHLNDLLHNHKDFEIKLTLHQDTVCFMFCDDRANNVETHLYKGMEVVVKDVLEFPEIGQDWYNIVHPFFGWVDGEALKKPKKVQKQSRRAKSVAQPVTAEAERFPFAFGETVNCLINNVWKVCTIQTTTVPVKVKFNGEKQTTQVDISNIRKVKSNQKFVVIVKNLPVRTQPNMKSFVSTHLKKGSKIEVVEFSGQFAKLNNPVGWIRARNDYDLSILEANYTSEIVLPTLRIKNLAENVHAKSVLKCLETQLGKKAHPFYFAGARINFTEAENGRKCALVVLPHRYRATGVLDHSLTEGFTLSGERLNIAFDFPYLRSAACPRGWCAESKI